MVTLAVSTWSLHWTLGPIYPDLALTSGERRREEPYGAGALDLLDLPAALDAHGMHLLEICHFHFPSTDAAYLAAFRARMDAANVQLLTLLVDAGDISAANSAARERDLTDTRKWIDIAAQLGARNVRVAAGDTEPGASTGAIGRSADGLAALARYADEQGVRLLTENWRPLAMDPPTLLAILDATGSAVGLCADFANFKGPGKYDALAAILPRAETVHAGAAFAAPGEMDEGDFHRCLKLARQAGFSGTYVVIFNSPGEEWAGIAQTGKTIREYA